MFKICNFLDGQIFLFMVKLYNKIRLHIRIAGRFEMRALNTNL